MKDVLATQHVVSTFYLYHAGKFCVNYFLALHRSVIPMNSKLL